MNKQEKLKILLRGCASCVYDEDEGALFRHCTKCQFEIAKLTYQLVIDDQESIATSIPVYSNGLTKAHEEMLELTKEECAELIKCCTKSDRFGLESNNLGALDHTNRVALTEECADVIACIAVLGHNHLIEITEVNQIAREKLDRIKAPGQTRVHFITPEMIP